MSNPYTEVIAETIVWVEATAVSLRSPMTVSLTETTGGGTVTGTLPAINYSKEGFRAALDQLLDLISPNDYQYTVTSEQINFDALPDTDPILWGSSFKVTKTGTGNFTIVLS